MAQPTSMPEPLHPKLPESAGRSEQGRPNSVQRPAVGGKRHGGQGQGKQQQKDGRRVQVRQLKVITKLANACAIVLPRTSQTVHSAPFVMRREKNVVKCGRVWRIPGCFAVFRVVKSGREVVKSDGCWGIQASGGRGRSPRKGFPASHLSNDCNIPVARSDYPVNEVRRAGKPSVESERLRTTLYHKSRYIAT
jgi:hypothetical protein